MAYTSINKSSDYFNTVLWTGNGSQRTITVGFQPDFSWLKNRGTADWHKLSDSVRGATKVVASNATNAEGTETQKLQSFVSTGFTIGTDGEVNGNGSSQVAWNWKANGAGSANTAGSINSTVSVNTTSGFSIVKWTGTGAIGTVGHGLGSGNIPKMIIVKNLNGYDWQVYHSAMGNGKYINLNTDAGEQTSSSRWNDTSPTDILFTVGGTGNVNQSGVESIAYCFAEKTGYSKFNSYTGNNQTGNNAPFIYTGFAPSFLLVKKYSDTNHWIIWDNKRSTKNGFNIIDKKLYANITNAENGADDVSFLSNGFKFNTNTGDWNEAQSYLYLCFGQSMVGSNNVPNNAR